MNATARVAVLHRYIVSRICVIAVVFITRFVPHCNVNDSKLNLIPTQLLFLNHTLGEKRTSCIISLQFTPESVHNRCVSHPITRKRNNYFWIIIDAVFPNNKRHQIYNNP